MLQTIVQQDHSGPSRHCQRRTLAAVRAHPRHTLPEALGVLQGLIPHLRAGAGRRNQARVSAPGAIATQQYRHPPAALLKALGQGNPQRGLARSSQGEVAYREHRHRTTPRASTAPVQSHGAAIKPAQWPEQPGLPATAALIPKTRRS